MRKPLEKAVPSPRLDPGNPHAIAWSSIAAAVSFFFIALYIYWGAFRFRSFGPEFAYFFELNQNLTFGGLLHKYLEFGEGWYRPTEFYTPYWLFSKFISWHGVTYWKIGEFVSLLVVCAVLYSLTRILFPAERLGAFLALVYFVSHPAHYLVLFEISAFDFLHQILVLACVCCFLLGCRASGRRSHILNGAGALAFGLALTAKEITFITPVYLAGAALVLIIFTDGEPRKKRAWRYGRLLLPYFALLAMYLLLHIARMPARPADSAYRTKANAAMILENVHKFPLWIIRVFGHTGDTDYQANELGGPAHDAAGYLLFLLVVVQWAVDLKAKRLRTPAILMILWVAAFLVLPAYAGAYLWHISLALAGYAVLLGIAVARLIRLVPISALRNALVLVFVAGLALLAKTNLSATLHAGVHATALRLNTEKLLTSPPVPASRIRSDTTIYIEDRLSLGTWSYGGGEGGLMRLAYLNPAIKTTLVRGIDEVPAAAALRWGQGKSVYFFRYDADFNWYDATGDLAARLRPGFRDPSNRMLEEPNARFRDASEERPRSGSLKQ